MISFDTENSPDGTLTLCIFFDGAQYTVFDYKKYKNQFEMKTAIIDFIFNGEEKLYIAHNLEYDLANILKPAFFGVVTWYYSGRLLFAEMEQNTKIKFIDTFNFSFSSVKAIGENIGLKKMDVIMPDMKGQIKTAEPSENIFIDETIPLPGEMERPVNRKKMFPVGYAIFKSLEKKYANVDKIDLVYESIIQSIDRQEIAIKIYNDISLIDYENNFYDLPERYQKEVTRRIVAELNRRYNEEYFNFVGYAAPTVELTTNTPDDILYGDYTEPPPEVPYFENIEYCKRDAEIVFRYYEKFNAKIRGAYNLPLKKTLAGTAQNILLKRFMKQKIDEMNIDDRILNGYHGGRCEVFNTARIDRYIVELDVNSMYPHVMAENVFPVANFFETQKPSEKNYIAHVKVTIKKNSMFPIIPKRDGLLYFPVGTFETYTSSIEIDAARAAGQIEKIEYLTTFNFPVCENIFNDFIMEIYGEREKAKNEKRAFDSMVYKYILNSSYGRFALHKPLRILTAINDENRDIIEPVDDVIGWIEKENDSDKNKNYGIAAFVTAYARVKLYDIIKLVTKKNYMVLYSDTDSCYFTTYNRVPLDRLFRKVYKDFTISNKLGELNCHIYAGGQFHNAKVYELYTLANAEKLKLKGIPEAFRREFLDTGTTTYKKPMKLRQGLTGVQGREVNKWYDHKVTKKSDYRKRDVNKDGTTRPKKFTPP